MSHTYTTPRTLLSILRLAQAAAKIRWVMGGTSVAAISTLLQEDTAVAVLCMHLLQQRTPAQWDPKLIDSNNQPHHTYKPTDSKEGLPVRACVNKPPWSRAQFAHMCGLVLASTRHTAALINPPTLKHAHVHDVLTCACSQSNVISCGRSFSRVVTENDVNEALRLMAGSKSSLKERGDGAQRREDPVSLCYRLVRG